MLSEWEIQTGTGCVEKNNEINCFMYVIFKMSINIFPFALLNFHAVFWPFLFTDYHETDVVLLYFVEIVDILKICINFVLFGWELITFPPLHVKDKCLFHYISEKENV